MRFDRIKFLSLILALSVLFCGCQITTPGFGENENSEDDDSSKGVVGYPNMPSISAQRWTPIFLATNEMDEKGIVGGIGNHPKTDLVLDQTEGRVLLIGTEQAGVLQSTNSGSLWQNTGIGISSLGATTFAIDSNNTRMVAMLAVQSTDRSEARGVYLSVDEGRTWKQSVKRARQIEGTQPQLVYDISSYNNETASSSTLYLTGVALRNVFEGSTNALYRSDDLGESFRYVSEIPLDAQIAVHPTKGYIYLVSSTGFYRSIDKGRSFELFYSGEASFLSVSALHPDTVIAVINHRIMISKDSGETFVSISGEDDNAIPFSNLVAFSVSPVDQTKMAAAYLDATGTMQLSYTLDGGMQWESSTVNLEGYGLYSDSSVAKVVWDPKNAGLVYALYQNTIVKSTDGGATYEWTAVGSGGMKIDSRVSFDLKDPANIVMIIDERMIAVSDDYGETWSVEQADDNNGTLRFLHMYIFDETTLVAAVYNEVTGKMEIRISKDGGRLFNPIGVTMGGKPYCYADPSISDCLFVGNMRSEDGGDTWKAMVNCDAVYAHNPVSPNELFGVCGNDIVMSVDHGKSWITLVHLGYGVQDMDYNYLDKTLHIVTGNRYFRFDRITGELLNCTNVIPLNQYNERYLSLVEIDDQYPQVMYVGGAASSYINETSVLVSFDSGENWSTATSTNKNDGQTSLYVGGRQPIDFFIDQSSRELYLFSDGFGMYKMAPYEIG